MKIVFLSVGKAHDAAIAKGIEDFTARIQKYFRVEWLIISPPKNAASLTETLLKKEEGKLILQHIDGNDYAVLLDERGAQMNSEEFAAFLQQRANESVRRIVFIIGGAYGTDASVMQRANAKWSLSKLVFPHMLVRLILTEQVYRACTILRNEKYHHS